MRCFYPYPLKKDDYICIRKEGERGCHGKRVKRITTREKVVQLGPIEATKKTEKTIPLPPLLGGIALAAGVVLIIAGSKN